MVPGRLGLMSTGELNKGPLPLRGIGVLDSEAYVRAYRQAANLRRMREVPLAMKDMGEFKLQHKSARTESVKQGSKLNSQDLLFLFVLIYMAYPSV